MYVTKDDENETNEECLIWGQETRYKWLYDIKTEVVKIKTIEYINLIEAIILLCQSKITRQ